MKPSQLIISRSDIGAGKRGAGLGPDALRTAAVEAELDVFRKLPVQEMPCQNYENAFHSHHNHAKHIDELYWTLANINKQSCRIFHNSDQTLILSGDHSNAGGLVSGFCQAEPNKRTGVLWIDAHADLHTPFTTPSGNMHGMPLAMTLGMDNQSRARNDVSSDVHFLWDKIKQLNEYNGSTLLNASDVVFIDVRDYEAEEAALLNELPLKYFTPEDRIKTGTEKILKQALEHLSGCDRLYVSFDVDSLDASIARGTGTPVKNGLNIEDATYLLRELSVHPKVQALEITEINPLLDTENNLAKTVAGILKNAIVQNQP